jgi:hypothetical protein
MNLIQFLREQGLQPWRIPILVACGGITLIRSGVTVPLNNATDRVLAKDIIRLADPTPQPCVNALAKEAGMNSRDYAFVPGSSPFEADMATLLEARPSTVRIRGVDSLASFIRELGNSAFIKNPIRDLIISSHSDPEGDLFIRMTIGSATVITYEDLEAAVKSKAIVIDGVLVEPRPTDPSGKPVAAQIIIRGCRIGRALPFLKKLKEALGNKNPVVAPKHLHVVARLTNPVGFMEYMAYGFTVRRPKQLKDRAAIVDAFITDTSAGAGFERIDGKRVEASEWNTWIPTKKLHNRGDNRWPNLVLHPVTQNQQNAPKTFRYRFRKLHEKDGSFAVAIDPGTESKRKELLKAELEKLDRYTAKHAYPEYERLGYASMTEFMDGWLWKFTWSKGTMFYNGARHEYTMIQPIVEKSSNTLILNFYPTGKHGSMLEMLKPTDDRFFARW